jgi:hypothetical protein
VILGSSGTGLGRSADKTAAREMIIEMDRRPPRGVPEKKDGQ